MPYAIGCLGAILFLLLGFGVAIEYPNLGLFFLFCSPATFIGSGFLVNKREKDMSNKVQKMIENKINTLYLNISQKFIGDDGESAIAIDEENKKVAIINNILKNQMVLSTTFSKYEYRHKIFDYRDILKSEILSDGKSINSTSTSSMLGGAVLGGILAGGVGAVLGGLSAEKQTTDIVKLLELQIVVNDTKNSIYRITFGAFDETTTINPISIKETEKVIHHWHNLLSHLIKIADEEDKESSEKNNINSNIDEIRKFGDLLKEGLISQEEYNLEKAKILKNH